MAFDPATLPVPIAPSLSATPTQDEIVRWNSYCEAVRHRAEVISLIQERERLAADAVKLQEWRDADILQKQACVAMSTSMSTLMEPTVDAILNAWNGLDAALNRLATGLGAPAPAQPPYQLPL